MEDTNTPNQPDESLEASMSSGIADNQPTTTLNEALIAARKQMHGTVYKDGYNKQQNYNFVGHEQVLMSGARDALLAHGLVLEQRSVEYAGELVAESDRGRRTIWHWTGTYALVHVSGEERPYRFAATTQPNDKGAFVASTALDRTAYLRVLSLTGSKDENPEANWHDDNREASRRAETYPPRQPQPAQQRRAPSNVVQLPARQPEPAPEWQGWLEAYGVKMRQRRTPDELVGWWVELVTTLPDGVDKGFVAAAWRMFQGYVKQLGHNFDRMRPEIDARVREAKKGGA